MITDPARPPRWRSALASWPVRDALPPATLAGAGAALAGAVPAPVGEQLHQALTLAAAAGAAAAAILVVAGARLAGDVAALRLGTGLLVYGGVVLPVTGGLSTSLGRFGPVVDLACFATVAALFAAALTRPERPVVPRAAALVVTAVAGVAALLPAAPRALALDAVLLGWGGIGVLLVLRGARGRAALLRRAGLGACLLVAASAPRLLPAGAPQSVVRVVGVGVVLVGAIGYAAAALRRQRAEHAAAARRLREAQEAERAADREAAERAHEMRNVVVGLSGAANLFTSGDATGHEALARALQAELGRLTELLDPDGADRPAAEFPVAPVLRTAVAVARARGTEVELDVAGNPAARGSAPALSQAVTNLLLNCERHAPGARVRVAARRDAGRVEVLVSDDGPGLPPGAEHRALRRGWKGAASTGSGLGLDISRRALREQGGDLRLLPPSPGGSGCRVAVELRAADRVGLPAAVAAGPSGGAPAAGRGWSR